MKKRLKADQKRIDTYISAINIAPTLIDLVGHKGDSAFKGRSFVSVLTGKQKGDFFDEAIWCFGRKALSLITKDYFKYILTFDEEKRYVKREYFFLGLEKEVPFEQIFNIKNDPFERNNVKFAK